MEAGLKGILEHIDLDRPAVPEFPGHVSLFPLSLLV